MFALIDEEGGGYTLHAFKSEKGVCNTNSTLVKVCSCPDMDWDILNSRVVSL